jgi:hypothetical protein
MPWEQRPTSKPPDQETDACTPDTATGRSWHSTCGMGVHRSIRCGARINDKVRGGQGAPRVRSPCRSAGTPERRGRGSSGP